MGTLITLWHGDHDKPLNRSQLVSIEFKSGLSYVKHAIDFQQIKFHSVSTEDKSPLVTE